MHTIDLYNRKTVMVKNTRSFGGVEEYFAESLNGTVYVKRNDGLYEPFNLRQQMAKLGRYNKNVDPCQQQYEKQKTA